MRVIVQRTLMATASLVFAGSNVTAASAEAICRREASTAINKAAVTRVIDKLAKLELSLKDGETVSQNAARTLTATRAALQLGEDDAFFLHLPAGKNYNQGEELLRFYPNINDCQISPTIMSSSDIEQLSYKTNTYRTSSGPLCLMLNSSTDVKPTETGYDRRGGAHSVAVADHSSIGLFLGYAGGGIDYRPWMELNIMHSNPNAAFEFKFPTEQVAKLGDRVQFYYLIKIKSSGFGSAYQGHTATASEPYREGHWARFLIGKLTCIGIYDPVDGTALKEYYFDDAETTNSSSN